MLPLFVATIKIYRYFCSTKGYGFPKCGTEPRAADTDIIDFKNYVLPMANKPKPSVKIQFLPLKIDEKSNTCTLRTKFVVSYDRKRIVFSEKSAPFAIPPRLASEYMNADGETISTPLTQDESQIAGFNASYRLKLLIALEMAIKTGEWATMTKPDFEIFMETHKSEIVKERLKREYGEAEAKKWIRKLQKQELI